MNSRNQTFITIHNLTPEANILFASDSLLDILGYRPNEVRGRSAFDYFHPEEVPFAHSVHSRGVLLDKAAVLHYARILSRSGQWISCECYFTIVYNVLVASTRRARDAPQIRRIFSSSPRDPRYRMLEHLSPKFKMPPMEREPRAALILNRFTRDLTIIYTTDAVAQILGVHSDEFLGKPFYKCIQSNCLDEAEKCLESAKTNESIAYLRFWYKDPRADPNDSINEKEEDKAEIQDKEADKSSSNDNAMDVEYHALKEKCIYIDEKTDTQVQTPDNGSGDEEQVPSGGSTTPRPRRHGLQAPRAVELEAVVSCTSDGLIVVLRRARSPIPNLQTQVMPAAFNYKNGLFAAPIDGQPVNNLARWEPNNSPPITYPPPEDLLVDRTSSLLKNQSTAATGPASHYASEPLFHSYHTRHASLDEDKYDASSSGSSNQLANSPPWLHTCLFIRHSVSRKET
ncbi:hypothetical protein NEMBOFW57_009523 [Staphylotrichum longicolle]|uniref:PAS domain-containing protein n=1 Tax=Staphylotrichum longicolle TaxID=669026 RepID=A0AAD4EP68_9PEZI|nr:hypothetical protein NEMBOFW57_009523 [Staphylotrichum longicolle]